jgi:hypothetical protein
VIDSVKEPEADGVVKQRFIAVVTKLELRDQTRGAIRPTAYFSPMQLA